MILNNWSLQLQIIPALIRLLRNEAIQGNLKFMNTNHPTVP